MAITAATFQAYERAGADRYRVQLELTRNDGPATREWFDVQGITLADIRNDLRNKLADRIERDGMRDILVGITPGTAIPITRPTVTPTVPTAKQLWLAEHARLGAIANGVALNGTALTDFNAKVAAHVATYAAGYLDA